MQDEIKSSGFDKDAQNGEHGTSANPTKNTAGEAKGSNSQGITPPQSKGNSEGNTTRANGGSGAPSSAPGGSQPSSSGVPSSTTGGSQSGGSGTPSSAPEPSQPSHSGTSSSDENFSGSSRPVDTAPSSTEDIPATQRENRTIGQYAKDRLSNAFHNSPTVQKTRRSYQLGQNTGEGLRNKRKNKNEGQNTNQNPPKNRRKDA
ncbi:hypothetical protein COO16_30810 [Bacillus pseudomycoides]|nr:hypothetical protein BLX05_29520 [Bacillus pseudomycoides]PDY08081.1 hypothetical protein COO16_30810 [Bacillus pseudomycoides]PFY12308.1 hypothetical protein COL42_24210 [Bacillus pseudomycoides]PGA67358.1 hypothetical protein COL89_24380 [Bacillus pseudomycoides]